VIAIDKKNKTIEFTPRTGFARKTKPVSAKLEFAHICPTCNNVIQALFHTKEEVKLWPYEETRMMTFDKDEKKPIEFKQLVPGKDDPDTKTQYNVFYDSKTNCQKIVLKNHILRFDTVDLKSTDNNIDWEPGGKMCELAGLFSLREDLLMRDYVLFSRINEARLWDFPVKSMSDVHFTQRFRINGFPIEAIGDAPPVILIRYTNVNRGWEHAVTEYLGHLKHD
jgi:hypothetical protein